MKPNVASDQACYPRCTPGKASGLGVSLCLGSGFASVGFEGSVARRATLSSLPSGRVDESANASLSGSS